MSALNDNGCGEYSTPSAPVVPFTKNRPSQPGRPDATVSATSVSLQWSMWRGDNETEHFRYVIDCREANKEGSIMYVCTERKAGAIINHTLTNKMLKPSTQYQFAVAACKEARLGPFSSYTGRIMTPPGKFRCCEIPHPHWTSASGKTNASARQDVVPTSRVGVSVAVRVGVIVRANASVRVMRPIRCLVAPCKFQNVYFFIIACDCVGKSVYLGSMFWSPL